MYWDMMLRMMRRLDPEEDEDDGAVSGSRCQA